MARKPPAVRPFLTHRQPDPAASEKRVARTGQGGGKLAKPNYQYEKRQKELAKKKKKEEKKQRKLAAKESPPGEDLSGSAEAE